MTVEQTLTHLGTVTPQLVVRVLAHELRGYTSYRQLDRVAAEHRFSTPELFAEFIAALRADAGIDYPELHENERAREEAHARLAEQAARGPHLLLWSATTREQFTLCRADRHVIWRQRFADLTPPVLVESDTAAIETSAQQAIWLAGQAREEWGAQSATLHLTIDRCRGRLLENLHQAAFVAGIILDLAADPDNNPAVEQSVDTGPVDWQRTDLGTLIHHRIPT